MDVNDIRVALQTRLQTITPQINTSPTSPDAVTVPFAYITFPTGRNETDAEYDEAFGDAESCVYFEVCLLVTIWDGGISQTLLDPYLGNDSTNRQSVINAIMSDKTLGGTVSDTKVSRAHSYGGHQVGNNVYLGCYFNVQVITNQ